MFFLKSAFCRVFQTAFRIALPFLPYREPEIIKSCSELEYVFRKERIKSPLIVTDNGITYTYGLKTGPSPVPWNFAKETGGTVITISGRGSQQNVKIENTVITVVE